MVPFWHRTIGLGNIARTYLYSADFSTGSILAPVDEKPGLQISVNPMIGQLACHPRFRRGWEAVREVEYHF